MSRPAAAGIVKGVEIRKQIEQIGQLYTDRVLSQHTRRVPLLGRKCQPRIMYTFLGFEVKMGRKRVTCPDMGTARYLKLFAELGMDSVQIPYDPSQTAQIVPQLEAAFDQIKASLSKQESNRVQRQAVLRRTYKKLRDELKKAKTADPRPVETTDLSG